MALTVGRKIRSGERGTALCDRCGTRWNRSDLWRDMEGLLNCPQEGRGRDATALTKANVASAKAYAHARDRPVRFPGRLDRDIPSAEEELQAWEPLGIPGYVLNLNPYQNVFTTSNGSGETVVNCFGSVVGKYNFPFANNNREQMPMWEPAGWVVGSSGISRPSIAFDGLDDALTCVNGVGQILTGGDDAPFTIFCVAQVINYISTRANVFFSTGDLSKASGGSFQTFSAGSTVPTWTYFKTPSSFVSGGVSDTVKHYMDVLHTGTFATVSVDGKIVAAGAQDVVDSNVNGMSLGKEVRDGGGRATRGNVRIARLLGFASVLSPGNMTYIRSKLAEIYF